MVGTELDLRLALRHAGIGVADGGRRHRLPGRGGVGLGDERLAVIEGNETIARRRACCRILLQGRIAIGTVKEVEIGGREHTRANQ